MALEFLALVEHRGWKASPLIRVRCTCCTRVYVTAQWPKNIRRAGGCVSCVQTARYRRRGSR